MSIALDSERRTLGSGSLLQNGAAPSPLLLPGMVWPWFTRTEAGAATELLPSAGLLVVLFSSARAEVRSLLCSRL